MTMTNNTSILKFPNDFSELISEMTIVDDVTDFGFP